MDETTAKHSVTKDHPEWAVYVHRSGKAFWIEVNSAGRHFTLEYVPGDGVGVSELTPASPDIDFGHDFEFDDLDSAVKFVANCITAWAGDRSSAPMSAKALELDNTTHQEIKRLCASGDSLAAQGKQEEALTEYNKAWKLIPEPKNEWEASTWILAAIADICFLMGKKKSARQALEYAMTCPGGQGNAFLHLRLGQVLLDAGEQDAAANELMRAYMGEGRELFDREDPRYLDFLGTRAHLSP